ncbi:MAG: hypothetical protein QOE73_487 [Verrucomicrobiota bacterium]|jgi:hypothetical protein
MGAGLSKGETETHSRLKRLALLWAQAQGFSACGLEVSLPQCRYRADIAAYRPEANKIGSTAVFECKQALPDLRRDNCCSAAARERLETVCRRRQVLEKHLRVHYPNLRIADTLFPEFDSHNFSAIEHRGYARVLRELAALQNRLYDCTKFEKLVRYGCANLFFLVLTEKLYDDTEIPAGWGALVESAGVLSVLRKPVRQENTPENRLRLLHRIAATGTRALNRQLEITFEDIISARCRSC